jgi:L-rhamnose-H+ transport protein
MYWTFITVFAAICSSSFALPMKFITRWKWENMWSVYSIWSLLVIPVVLSIIAVPNLPAVYASAGWHCVGLVFIFGALWGIGSAAFGIGLDYFGVGLAYSVIDGMIIAIGSLLPLLSMSAADLRNTNVAIVVIGVIVILLGVCANGRAAVLKNRDDATAAFTGGEQVNGGGKSALKVITLCIVSGILSPMLQYAFIYGKTIVKHAVTMGVSQTMAANSIWVAALSGGFVSNIGCCLLILKKNKSWQIFRLPGNKRYYLYTFIMGILWTGAIAIYGMAATNMGKLGPSVGWAILNAVCIIWANILSLSTGEWKNARGSTMLMLAAGLFILVAGICTVAWANT